jgi:hypothetical protein
MPKKKIILKDSLPLILTDGCNFETLMSQLQPYVEDSILAVKNGEELKIFKKTEDIPSDLVGVGKTTSNINYFRSKRDKDLYSFFGDDVLDIVRSKINKPRSKDTISQNGKIYFAIHSMHKRAPLNTERIYY